MTLLSRAAVAAVLVSSFACSNAETEARSAAFYTRFGNVKSGMPKSELLQRIGEPNSVMAASATKLCSETPHANEVLVYELRQPHWWKKDRYVVSAQFVVCLDANHNVVNKSLIQF